MPREVFIFWCSPHPLSRSSGLAADLAMDLTVSVDADNVPVCFRHGAGEPPEQAMISFGGNLEPWADGGVFRTVINEPAMQVYCDMYEPLSDCSNFLIYEANGLMFEHPHAGPAGRFADVEEYGGYVTKHNQFMEFSTKRRFALIMLVRNDSDRSYDLNVEAVRGAEKTKCWPIFYFRNGQVMMLESPEPVSMIVARAAKHLDKFSDWAITDSEGVTKSSRGLDDRVWIQPPPVLDDEDGDNFELLTEVERVFGKDR
jgi:hypothetical protein